MHIGIEAVTALYRYSGWKSSLARITIGKLIKGWMIISQVWHNDKVANEKLLYIWGWINDKWFLMLLDTGASNNFIAAKVMKSLGLEVKNCPESIVMLANISALRKN